MTWGRENEQYRFEISVHACHRRGLGVDRGTPKGIAAG